ncbi:MAG TPA: hypothetical protein DDY54_08100 [Deltaproteobacteria bacterium]|nr:hypothetical protein [Deltaproteobacteria bacterium]
MSTVCGTGLAAVSGNPFLFQESLMTQTTDQEVQRVLRLMVGQGIWSENMASNLEPLLHSNPDLRRFFLGVGEDV